MNSVVNVSGAAPPLPLTLPLPLPLALTIATSYMQGNKKGEFSTQVAA